MDNLPWLAGSVGTMFEDAIVSFMLCQQRYRD